MKNIMIDLETMGSGSNAAIVSVGAVVFDENGIGATFYRKVSLKDSVSLGLDIDTDTVLWWMKQSDEARAELTDSDSFSLGSVLSEFSDFARGGGHTVVWGCGSDFDNVILANAWGKAFPHIKLPWEFWNNRCYRTVKNLFRDVKMERTGTHHNALDDAISQAEHLIKIANEKGIKL